MPPFSENNINTKVTGVTMRNISKDQQQTVLLFRANSECNENALEDIHKTIVGKILSGRDVIVVTKEDRLMDLISDAVEDTDLNYISENAVEIISFVPKPESHVKHHATLVKKFPLSAAKDLASSSEFTYGNLWFLIPSNDTNIDQCSNDVIKDIRKLSTFIINELPILKNEAVALPAMYDGREILWFKPNHDVYQNGISSPF